MTYNIRHLLLPALVAMLQACTSLTLAPVPDGLTVQAPDDWPQRMQALHRFSHWQLSGKLAVRQRGDSGTALINRWRQQGERYQLALSSAFLGMGNTYLQGNSSFMELTLPNGDRYQSANPEALVADATGWQLPLPELRWWIRGLPAPAKSARLLFDASGHLALMYQSGWEIHYERRQAFVAGLPELPARLTAVKGDRRVRLVITDWQALEAQP